MEKYLPQPQHLPALMLLGIVLIYTTLNRSGLLWPSLVIIMPLALIPVVKFVRNRSERHKIFDQCNIPSIGNKSIFSGNSLEVVAPVDSVKIVLKYFDTLKTKTYGFFYGPDPWVCTMDPELIEKIHIQGGSLHINDMDVRSPYVSEIDKALFQLRGDEWRRVRKALNPGFSHKQMQTDNVFKSIEGTCEKLCQLIQDHPPLAAAGPTTRTVNALYTFERYTMENLCRVAYANENSINMKVGETDELLEVVNGLLKRPGGVLHFLSVIFEVRSFLKYFTRFTAMGRDVRRLRPMLDRNITLRRERREQATKQSQAEVAGDRRLIDTLIDSVDRKQIDDDTLKANMYFLALAGFETTANALTAMFWLLAHHQDKQEKLRQAIQTSGGEQCSYLDWCINESLRLFPVGTGVSRVLEEDVILPNGQKFLKGFSVIAVLQGVHQCEDYWGPDVKQFRPERFGEKTPSSNHFLPFGAGLRYCMGKNLAISEMRAITRRLLSRYLVETCESTPKEIQWTSPTLIHMKFHGPVNLNFVELSSNL